MYEVKDIPIGFSLGDSESHISIPISQPAYPQVNPESDLICKDYVVGLTTHLEENDKYDIFSKCTYFCCKIINSCGIIY